DRRPVEAAAPDRPGVARWGGGHGKKMAGGVAGVDSWISACLAFPGAAVPMLDDHLGRLFTVTVPVGIGVAHRPRIGGGGSRHTGQLRVTSEHVPGERWRDEDGEAGLDRPRA